MLMMVSLIIYTYLFGFCVDELYSAHVHGEDERVWVGPEPLVSDVVEDAAVERVVLHRRQVPNLRLNISLPGAIFLTVVNRNII